MKPVAIDTQRGMMLIAQDPQVESLIPHSKAFVAEGRHVIALPYGESETVMLRNLGYRVRSRFRSYYDWGALPPFDHQVVTAELLTNHSRGYVLSDPGTGKTRAVLAALDWLLGQGLIHRILVVAPLSILESVWVSEVFRWIPHRQINVIHGPRAKRLKLLAERKEIDVVNYDGVKFTPELLNQGYDCVVLDESTAVKNRTSKRWKAVNTVAKNAKRIYAMTGTPIPQSPMDAHGQLCLVTPRANIASKVAFRYMVMHQILPHKWLPKPDAQETVHKLMQPAVRFKSEDCIDLPDIVETVRQAPMSSKQILTFKAMRDAMVVHLSSDTVTAANAGVMLNKLLQIGAGFVYDSDRTGIPLDPSPRLADLERVVDQTENKSIIFTNFKYSLDLIADHLIKSGYSVARVSGDTAPAERGKIFREFQQEPDPHVLVAHPAVAAHGVTLTEADQVVWYDLPHSYERYVQANARIHRPGQVNRHFVVHLIGNKVEAKVLKRLQEHKSAQNVLLEMYEAHNF